MKLVKSWIVASVKQRENEINNINKTSDIEKIKKDIVKDSHYVLVS